MIQTRHPASAEFNESMVFFSAIGIALITACVAPLYWQTPPAADAVLLVLVGFVSALHTLLVQAYRFAPVYLLGPFDYTALVWAILFGFLIWREVPGMAMLAGASLIVGCGFYL